MSSALYQRRRGCPHSQETSSGSIFSAAKENSHLLVVAVVGLHVCAAYAPPDRGPALADLTSLTAEYFVSNPNHHAQPFLFALDGKANAKLTILSPIVLIIFPRRGRAGSALRPCSHLGDLVSAYIRIFQRHPHSNRLKPRISPFLQV